MNFSNIDMVPNVCLLCHPLLPDSHTHTHPAVCPLAMSYLDLDPHSDSHYMWPCLSLPQDKLWILQWQLYNKLLYREQVMVAITLIIQPSLFFCLSLSQLQLWSLRGSVFGAPIPSPSHGLGYIWTWKWGQERRRKGKKENSTSRDECSDGTDYNWRHEWCRVHGRPDRWTSQTRSAVRRL